MIFFIHTRDFIIFLFDSFIDGELARVESLPSNPYHQRAGRGKYLCPRFYRSAAPRNLAIINMLLPSITSD